MEFIIKTAQPEMIAEIQKIENICFSDPWTERMIYTMLSGNGRLCLTAADHNGSLAGYIFLMPVLDEGQIANVAVAPEYRRRGLGRGLLDAAASWARSLSILRLMLDVRQSNTPAIGLYESYGFKIVGKRRDYYESPKEDSVLMTYFLEEKS